MSRIFPILLFLMIVSSLPLNSKASDLKGLNFEEDPVRYPYFDECKTNIVLGKACFLVGGDLDFFQYDIQQSYSDNFNPEFRILPESMGLSFFHGLGLGIEKVLFLNHLKSYQDLKSVLEEIDFLVGGELF